MIKIEIIILDGQLDIEIKKSGDDSFLVVILSKSSYFKENGRIWTGKTKKEENVREIKNLIRKCYIKPSKPKVITINDGTIIKINLNDDESEVTFLIENSDEEMTEFQLMKKVFEFINDLVNDADLLRYTKIFGKIR